MRTAALHLIWKWYRRKGEDFRFMGQVELHLRIYAKHEIVRMLQEAGWEIIELLHDHRTMEKARINSPINIIAKKPEKHEL